MNEQALNVDGSSIVFIVTAIVGGSGFGILIKSWADKRKTASESAFLDAQTRDVLVQAGERTVEMIGAQLDRALARIAVLEQRVRDLEDENDVLKRQIGGVPGGMRATDPKE